jgi:cytochrome c-type biogenesis protein CcmF
MAVFVIMINAKVSYLFLARNFSKAGGYLAHVGLGFMVIGIITSSIYDSSEKVMLPQGQYYKTEFGHEIKFVNFVPMPDGRDRVKLLVKTAQGAEYEAYPQFYYSDYSKAYMVSPDVKVQFNKDIYISPISFSPASLAAKKEITLSKTQSTDYGDMEITFNKFQVDMSDGNQKVTADLTVKAKEEGYPKEYNLMPVITASNGQMTTTDAEVPNSPYRIRIASVSAGTGEVTLSILSSEKGSDARDMLAVEVSEKPLISVLWFGALIFAFGAFLSLVDRVRAKSS